MLQLQLGLVLNMETDGYMDMDMEDGGVHGLEGERCGLNVCVVPSLNG